MIAWAMLHWPILAGIVAAYYTCDVYLRYEYYPLRVFMFFALIGGSILYDLLFYQKVVYGRLQKLPSGPAPYQDQEQQAGTAGTREKWEYSSDGARQGWARDQLGRPVQVSLPACAEYHRLPKDTSAFDRVIGLEKAKEAIKDAFSLILGYTEEAKRLKVYGVKPPKGILLYGPPGTGKTSFARAAAQVYGCSFVVVNASAVAAPWVGQTEENIRQVFRFAKANAPCVVFWDEIDAVAKKRGAAVPNSPSDLAINTILTEMDGFAGSEGVVVIAATNRVDQLVEALLRPGRFDVKIEVGLPKEKDRETR
ncbi:MAG: ATP-binding protein, partial [Desulfotomaculales bacterium]